MGATASPAFAGLLAGLLLLGAGCIADGPGEGAAAPSPEPPTVLHAEGQVTASGPVAAIGTGGHAFSVGPNVTLLLAEIEWEDPVQDIDLALASPAAGTTGTAQNFDHRAEGGAPGSPDSPHGLAVAAPEPGEWQASAFGNGASAVVPYRIALTLFHGEAEVPDGYSGLA